MKILTAWESEDGSELVLSACGRPAQHGPNCTWDLGPDAFPRMLVSAPPKRLVAPPVDMDGNPLPLPPKDYVYETNEARLERAYQSFRGRFEARKVSLTRPTKRRERSDLVGSVVADEVTP